MITIILRLFILYAVIMLSLHLGGKRQIGELEPSELVTTLILSELAAIPISDPTIPLAYAVIPVIILSCIEVILSFITTKSNFLKKALDGRPSIVIDRGRLDQKELSRIRMSLEELLSELRLNGIADIKDVRYAIMEQNGRLSVLSEDDVSDDGLAHPLIVDGHISEFNLPLTGTDRDGLMKKISDSGLTLKEVFLFTINDAGEENLIRRNKK